MTIIWNFKRSKCSSLKCLQNVYSLAIICLTLYELINQTFHGFSVFFLFSNLSTAEVKSSKTKSCSTNYSDQTVQRIDWHRNFKNPRWVWIWIGRSAREFTLKVSKSLLNVKSFLKLKQKLNNFLKVKNHEINIFNIPGPCTTFLFAFIIVINLQFNGFIDSGVVFNWCVFLKIN